MWIVPLTYFVGGLWASASPHRLPRLPFWLVPLVQLVAWAIYFFRGGALYSLREPGAPLALAALACVLFYLLLDRSLQRPHLLAAVFFLAAGFTLLWVLSLPPRPLPPPYRLFALQLLLEAAGNGLMLLAGFWALLRRLSSPLSESWLRQVTLWALLFLSGALVLAFVTPWSWTPPHLELLLVWLLALAFFLAPQKRPLHPPPELRLASFASEGVVLSPQPRWLILGAALAGMHLFLQLLRSL